MKGSLRNTETVPEQQAVEDDDPFEALAARCVTSVAERVSQDVRFLVFSSPVCTRRTDVSLLWHPVYRNGHKARLLLKALAAFPLDLAKGVLRLAPPFRQYGWCVSGEIDDRVLVTPSLCAEEVTPGQYRTPYVASQADDALYLFGLRSSFGGGAKTMRLRLLADLARPFFVLARATLGAALVVSGPWFEKVLIWLSWCSWLVSLRWLELIALHRNLSAFVKRNRVARIGCIHEMHEHARVVWDVASRHGARSCTVQHAAFSKGKRWLFPSPDEVDAGLALPDVFYVYENQIVEMLQEHYRGTTFVLGSSSRYSQIREAEPFEAAGIEYYLFATALPSFDNDVVLGSIKRILAQRSPGRIRVRLHPAAQLVPFIRSWLRSAQRSGTVEVSSGTSLNQDLQHAIAVVGMGSTVLEEGLIMGRPVVQIAHPSFRKYLDLEGLPSVSRVDYKKFSNSTLESLPPIDRPPLEARRRLGLTQPEVTYDRLFPPQ